MNCNHSPKEQVIETLQRFPGDLSFEDIQDHIDVLERWNLSEQVIREGRVCTQAEVEERMERLFATLEQEARERETDRNRAGGDRCRLPLFT